MPECEVARFPRHQETAVFDKSTFKTDSFDVLPSVQSFFAQPTGERRVENIDEVRRSLSDIRPFSRLPKALQEKVLQTAYYECYPEEHVIVRQHDEPDCFRVILSGTAVLTYMRVFNGLLETLGILERGSTFGEKGLLTDTEQIFTVTSKTKLELLVLSREDFQTIYMTNDRHCSKDDLKFLKNQVSFLRGFPIDRLNEFPHAIQHCSYGLSEVIARDSRRMKHIFVVKRGSLAIWKRLDPDGPSAKSRRNDFDPIDNERMSDENGAGDDNEATGDNSTLFSEVQLSGDVDESNNNGGALENDYRVNQLRRPTLTGRRTSVAPPVRPPSSIDMEKKFPGIADKRDRVALVDYDRLAMPTVGPRFSLLTDLSRRSRSSTQKSKMILPGNMIYVHLKTLNEGQYFGLADMLFPNQPALTLVSNECECLLLRKSSFVRIASDQYKQNIRRTEIPYPSDAVFYKSYHTNEVWKRYSKNVYRDACERIRQRHLQPIQRLTKSSNTPH